MPSPPPLETLHKLVRNFESIGHFDVAIEIISKYKQVFQEISERIETSLARDFQNIENSVLLKRLRLILKSTNEIELTAPEGLKLVALELTTQGIEHFSSKALKLGIQSYDREKGNHPTNLKRLTNSDTILIESEDLQKLSLSKAGYQEALQLASEKWTLLESVNHY